MSATAADVPATAIDVPEGLSIDRLGLKKFFGGTILTDEPLSRHTSMGVGGPVEALVIPGNEDDLPALLAHCREERIPCHVMGRGTNLIAADRRHPGIVVKIAGTLRQLTLGKTEIRAGAGVSLPALARLTVSRGLEGLEFAGGIPGTIGGAITMNAGLPGREIGSVLREVRILRPGGTEEKVPRDRMRFAYRETSLDDAPGMVVEATLDLAPSDPLALRRTFDEWQRRREVSQPLSLPNSGSIFRNPPGDYAGRLIEALGAKGWREGGAEISQLHANFIVNPGGGTAADVLRLMWRAWRAVNDTTGISLRPEVHFLGFGPEEALLPGSHVPVDFSSV